MSRQWIQGGSSTAGAIAAPMAQLGLGGDTSDPHESLDAAVGVPGLSLSYVLVVGSLVRDGEYRQTAGGLHVLVLLVATVDDQGRKPRTDVHRVVVFGPRAVALRDVKARVRVLVEGSLQQNHQRARGHLAAAYVTEIHAREVRVL